MNRLMILLCALALLTGCSSGPTVRYDNISLPELNSSNTVFLGDRLLMQARGYYTDTLDVGHIRGKFVEISAGRYCRQPGTDEYVSFNKNSIRFINFVGGTRGYTNRRTYREEKNEVCIDDIWSGCFDSSYGMIDRTINGLCADPNSFQQIIEYNGKAGNILNFTYREFSHDRMRTPFTTNFTMDLTEGDTITYKGARLKIEKATNQQIVYIVLRNFN